MPIHKKTLRKMPPKTREMARLTNELESVLRRLRNRLSAMASMERWERAEMKRQQVYGAQQDQR